MENGYWNILEIRLYKKAFLFTFFFPLEKSNFFPLLYVNAKKCVFSGPDTLTLLSFMSVPEEGNMNFEPILNFVCW